MNPKVLVIGATGMAGRGVVRELVKAGIPVRALVRDVQKAKRILTQPVDLLAGDVFIEADVQRAMADGITHVYFHPAATIHQSIEKSMDRMGTQRLIKHFPDAVHLIKLSEIGASHNPEFYDIDYKHRSELDIQERVANWTILRPTWFMESIPQLLTMGPSPSALVSRQTQSGG